MRCSEDAVNSLGRDIGRRHKVLHPLQFGTADSNTRLCLQRATHNRRQLSVYCMKPLSCVNIEMRQRRCIVNWCTGTGNGLLLLALRHLCHCRSVRHFAL